MAGPELFVVTEFHCIFDQVILLLSVSTYFIVMIQKCIAVNTAWIGRDYNLERQIKARLIPPVLACVLIIFKKLTLIDLISFIFNVENLHAETECGNLISYFSCLI